MGGASSGTGGSCPTCPRPCPIQGLPAAPSPQTLRYLDAKNTCLVAAPMPLALPPRSKNPGAAHGLYIWRQLHVGRLLAYAKKRQSSRVYRKGFVRVCCVCSVAIFCCHSAHLPWTQSCASAQSGMHASVKVIHADCDLTQTITLPSLLDRKELCSSVRTENNQRTIRPNQDKTAELSQRRPRAICAIYGCPEKFWESSLRTRLLVQKFVMDFCSDRY